MEKNYTILYKGDLRCEAKHLKSGCDLTTDAPTDNNGKGEQFSPTDLLATALTTCILTVVGIYFRKKGRELTDIHCDVQKVMASDPRRIKEVIIHFDFLDNEFTYDEYKLIEHYVHHCPVTESLSKDIMITTNIASFYSS
ncbi:MAG: OsmC family protein [Crocinitomicaceae bacterium]|nr:OsmC family protein [Crocinitomicaceae bacterium]